MLDARYGYKQEATLLLIEWVQTVGADAGVGPSNARISTGALGAPESRLELEVSFDSMSDWEAFLARIPAQQHRAWSQRVQGMVVDGSPKWEVFRVVDVPSAAGAEPRRDAGAAAAPALLSSPWGFTGDRPSGGSGGKLVFADKVTAEDAALWELSKAAASASSSGGRSVRDGGASSGDGDRDGDGQDEGEATLDWKGDPIKFSPGDKIPFKFL